MRSGWAVAGLALLGAGCASSSQVETTRRLAEEAYQRDIVTAREWEAERLLGIPSAGWVAIWITGLIVAGVLLVGLGFWVHHVIERRAENLRRAVADAQITERARLEAPSCPVCGHDRRITDEVVAELARVRSEKAP